MLLRGAARGPGCYREADVAGGLVENYILAPIEEGRHRKRSIASCVACREGESINRSKSHESPRKPQSSQATRLEPGNQSQQQ